jgi:hypothetical protein
VLEYIAVEQLRGTVYHGDERLSRVRCGRTEIKM